MRRFLRSRRVWQLCLMSLVLVAVGCVKESASRNQYTYTFAFWVPIGGVLGGIALAAAGWFVKEKEGRIGWGMVVCGPLMALVSLNQPLLDKVTVTDEQLDAHVGGIR